MSGLPYQGGMNPYVSDFSYQYGVNYAPSPARVAGIAGAKVAADVAQTSNFLKSGSSLASYIPYIGPLIGAGMNIAGTYMQNQQQEYFYNRYMSPQARMRQMIAAGINPNAAAEGISGAAAPQITAASPTSAFSSLGEQLGQSANTALTAGLIKSETEKNNAEKNLTDSLNVEKSTTNKYLDQMQIATLNKLVEDGKISKSFANMAAVDEAYKPATAYANYQQLLTNLSKTGAEINELYSRITQEYAAAYQSMANASLSEAQIHKVFSDIGLNNAQINKISHEVNEIDARTAATYQEISESQARTALLNIQNKFQLDYYDIWKTTGFNWNSDIEKSIVGAASNLQIDEAERMLNGLGMYVKKTGDARSEGKDFTYDKITEILGDVLHFAGMAGLGKGVSSSPTFRPRTSDGRAKLF